MKRFLFLLIAISFFAKFSNAQVSQGDFEALVALYNATDGDNWNHKDNWNINGTANDVTSSWYGVTVEGGRVISIDLSQNNLIGFIPSEIENISNLKELKLFDNKIESIPAEIGNLDQLQILILTKNNLASVPPEIGNLSSLGILSLAVNNLRNIPAEIGNLELINDLSLSSNPLESLPIEIFNLNTLKNLALTSTQLTTLPTEISNLTSLTHLFLADNNLETIPKEIGNLSNLDVLHLQMNNLTYLPKELGNLSSLNYLYLYENELQEIPAEIGNLEQLLALFLNDNQLKYIPVEIGKLSSLNSLVLRHNSLTKIPLQIGDLKKLNYLQLNENKIETIPNEISLLSQLIDLNLESNQLIDLPVFTSLIAIETISVSNNKLSFEDIEPNIGIASIGFNYSSQDTIGQSKQIYGDLDNQLKLIIEVGGEHNVYTWFKDGVEIPNSNNDTLTIENFSSNDKGIYTCEINNTVATELTLISHPIHVMVTGFHDIKKELANVFPNPSSGQFNITLSEKPNANTQLKVLDLSGKTIYQQELNDIENEINIDSKYKGTYLLQITNDEKVYNSYKILLVD